MTQEFKEFLKEYYMHVEWGESNNPLPILFEGKRSAVIENNDKVIPLKDLGEWAWKYFVESFYCKEEAEHWLAWHKLSKKERLKAEKEMPIEPLDSNINSLNIAVACLGSQEIKKRLTELQKK